MKHFFNIQDKLIKDTPGSFQRFLYGKINFSNRMIGIVGPRGVGKTTLLLQHLKKFDLSQKQALYVSLDDIYFSKNHLLFFAGQFVDEYDGKLLILDEVHKYPNWNQELKNIYDSFPRLKIIFSGSSGIDLIKGRYDLSRRVVLYRLPGLSFREYLLFNKGKDFEVQTIEKILKNHLALASRISGEITVLREFKKYLEKGYYPFQSESGTLEYYQKINSTIEKTIYLDIARFYPIKSKNLAYLSKILYYLATIQPGKIRTNNIAKNLGIANETVDEYLEYLRETSLLRYLYIDAMGSKLIRNAEKVFLDNPAMIFSINSSLDKAIDKGQVRELFVLNQLQNAGLIPTRASNADIKCKGLSLEIGGRNKTWDKKFPKEKNNFLVKDDIVIGEKNEIPLYLFGFLY